MDDRILVKLPEWAICAIEYDDYSGVDENDARLIKEWLDDVKSYGYDVVIGDGEHYFSSFPEFGLACDVVDSYLVKRNEV